MVAFLSQEWLDRQREETASVPERPGATARIGYEISGGPDGPVVFHTQLEDGRITTNALGPDDEADFVMILPHDEFVRVVRGEAAASEGYMQGRVKVTGNVGRMLSVLPVTGAADWRAAMARLADVTEF